MLFFFELFLGATGLELLLPLTLLELAAALAVAEQHAGHLRARGDALYNSNIEPRAEGLTGAASGRFGESPYAPVAMAFREAHLGARG